MLSVYLDTNVWNFLDGQEHSDCEDIRPSWEMLAGLRRSRKVRLVSSLVVLEEVVAACYRRMERSKRLYECWRDLVGTKVLREHRDLIASEILAALKNRRFSPWAPKGIVRMVREFRPEEQDFRGISDECYRLSQNRVKVFTEFEEDFKARVLKAGFALKDVRLDIRKNTHTQLRQMIPEMMLRHGKRIRARQMDRILKRIPAAYAFFAFQVASTADRTPRNKRYKASEMEDAWHFAYGVYVDRLVSADADFIQIAKLVPDSGVTMMSLKDFCNFVRKLTAPD